MKTYEWSFLWSRCSSVDNDCVISGAIADPRSFSHSGRFVLNRLWKSPLCAQPSTSRAGDKKDKGSNMSGVGHKMDNYIALKPVRLEDFRCSNNQSYPTPVQLVKHFSQLDQRRLNYAGGISLSVNFSSPLLKVSSFAGFMIRVSKFYRRFSDLIICKLNGPVAFCCIGSYIPVKFCLFSLHLLFAIFV